MVQEILNRNKAIFGSLQRYPLWRAVFFIAQAMASTPVQKDSPVINTLFAQTKPQCIGRYVIDVPESFNNQLHDKILSMIFKIESKTLYPPAFKQRMEGFVE
jgi:hypothetical protein